MVISVVFKNLSPEISKTSVAPVSSPIIKELNEVLTSVLRFILWPLRMVTSFAKTTPEPG